METMSVKALKGAMILAGFGVSELSKRAEIQQPLISKWLKREKVSVRLPTLSKISRALNVSADDLILEE